MKVYKVVDAFDGIMISARIRDDHFTVFYALGQKAVPRIKGTCLMAFDSLRSALDFRRSGEKVLLCQATRYRGKSVGVAVGWDESLRCAWWPKNKYRILDSDMNGIPLPQGTVLCSLLTPSEIVK